MPFDSFSDIVDVATDVSSEVVDSGQEFLADSTSELQGQVSDFAGDPAWFDANNFSEILPTDTTTLSSSFNFDSLTGSLPSSLPSLSSLVPSSLPTIDSITSNFSSSLPSLSSIVDKLPSASSVISSAVTQVENAAIRTATGLITSIPGGSTVLGLVNGGGNLSSIDFGNAVSSLANSAINTVTSTVTSTVTGTINGLIATGTGIATSAIKTATGLSVNPTNLGLPTFSNIGNTIGGLASSAANVIIPSAQAATVPQPVTGTVTVTGAPDPTATGTTAVAPPLSDQQQAAQDVQEGYVSAPVANAVPDGQKLDTSPAKVTPTPATVGVAYDDEGNLLPGYELNENNDPVYVGAGTPPTVYGPVATAPIGAAYDEEGNLLPGYAISATTGQAVYVGAGVVAQGTQALADAGRAAALAAQARNQQTIRDQRQNKAAAGDWRVRLRLAPQSNYLYNAPNPGPVLWPLQVTDGVIFPYTPKIDTVYKANYDSYDLTHSNYRGYFYKGSNVEALTLSATFTAQNTQEANYLLAVIHFFRSVTKMFYGQDAYRGSPPPLTYLSGFGDFQFNEHPCVVSQFNYSLPNDVNYIRAQSTVSNGTDVQPTARTRNTVASNPLSYALQRLNSVGLTKGGLDSPFSSTTLPIGNPTYVPTKMEITLTLLPMQSRQQVSKQFSVKEFANGNLLKGGFW